MSGVVSQDKTRSDMLRYFYDRRSRATSESGKKGLCVKISDIKRELKAMFNLSQAEVVANLDYLVQKGWVRKEEAARSFQAESGARYPSTSVCYKISAEGVDKIEGESEFSESPQYRGINIKAVQSVVTLGDGNVVNARFREVRPVLERLRQEASSSHELDDEAKLSIAGDIDALIAQLATPKPDKSIVQKIWGNIERLAASTQLAAMIGQIGPMLIAGLS